MNKRGGADTLHGIPALVERICHVMCAAGRGGMGLIVRDGALNATYGRFARHDEQTGPVALFILFDIVVGQRIAVADFNFDDTPFLVVGIFARVYVAVHFVVDGKFQQPALLVPLDVVAGLVAVFRNVSGGIGFGLAGGDGGVLRTFLPVVVGLFRGAGELACGVAVAHYGLQLAVFGGPLFAELSVGIVLVGAFAADAVEGGGLGLQAAVTPVSADGLFGVDAHFAPGVGLARADPLAVFHFDGKHFRHYFACSAFHRAGVRSHVILQLAHGTCGAHYGRQRG